MAQNTQPYKAGPQTALVGTNATVSSSSSQIMAANAERKTLILSNPTSGLTAATMYISFFTPAVSGKGIALGPGQNLVLYRCPTSTMYAIAPGVIGTANICIQELV